MEVITEAVCPSSQWKEPEKALRARTARPLQKCLEGTVCPAFIPVRSQTTSMLYTLVCLCILVCCLCTLVYCVHCTSAPVNFAESTDISLDKELKDKPFSAH